MNIDLNYIKINHKFLEISTKRISVKSATQKKNKKSVALKFSGK